MARHRDDPGGPPADGSVAGPGTSDQGPRRDHVLRLGHRGDGVTASGVFAPRSLPGETVEGAVVAGRMESPRILTPSPHRVAALCRHYEACGGCALQHAADGFVTGWKQDQIVAALALHGVPAPAFDPPHVSPPSSRRRATLAGRRLKSDVVVGFHARASATLTAVPACRVLHPELLAVLPVLQALTREGTGRRATLALAVARSAAGVDVAVRGGKPADGALAARLAAIACDAGLARLTWEGEVLAQLAPPAQTMGRARVVPPPGAFLQATAEGERALVAALTRWLGPARRIADLFAGCGTFALPLAEMAEVHAVEADAAMLAALEAGWRGAPGLRRVTVAPRDLFRAPLAPAELARFDAVVVDPPRAGMAAQAAALAASQVPVVLHVSCNPATFARDAAILCAGGFVLERVQLVDQFRWSPHVELAARFSRAHIAGHRPGNRQGN